MSRIGIIDWGIGAVSIYKLTKEQMPGVPITYFSDTGVTPYGKMSRRELAARLDTVIEYLKTRNVSHIVIGCNAASTAIHDLADHGIPVVGVIEPAVQLTARIRPQRLGLIGGRRTVVSGVHRRFLAKHGINVRGRIAQPLSALIESGDINLDRLHSEAARILRPLRACSHVLLACTHYPAIMSVLSHHAPNVRFIDPAEELVREISHQKISDGSGRDEFLTTGSTAGMKRAAKTAFGVIVTAVVRTKL